LDFVFHVFLSVLLQTVSDELGFFVELCESTPFSALSFEQKVDYVMTVAKTVLFFTICMRSEARERVVTSAISVWHRTMRSMTLVTKSAKGTPHYAPSETMDDDREEHKITDAVVCCIYSQPKPFWSNFEETHARQSSFRTGSAPNRSRALAKAAV
jgi:hypothetical protein